MCQAAKTEPKSTHVNQQGQHKKEQTNTWDTQKKETQRWRQLQSTSLAQIMLSTGNRVSALEGDQSSMRKKDS